MKSIHIRNIDEGILFNLKRRAQRHRRSLQKEVEAVLADAAAMIPAADQDRSSLARMRINHVATGKRDADWSREEIYGDDGR